MSPSHGGGKRSLTLRGFGTITIKEKNGEGSLIIEDDNGSVVISELNGPGHVYLRNKGAQKITTKDGLGDILFKGAPPIIGTKNSSGVSKREQ